MSLYFSHKVIQVSNVTDIQQCSHVCAYVSIYRDTYASIPVCVFGKHMNLYIKYVYAPVCSGFFCISYNVASECSAHTALCLAL